MFDPSALSAKIKSFAYEQGFALAGIARAAPAPHADAYRAWIAAGKHGRMDYLAKNIDERLDIQKKFPWAKTILCVALPYYQSAPAVSAEPAGKIARYAWGRDYHKTIAAKLKHFEASIRELAPAAQIRAYCDTGPILERDFAAAAGLGWIGKHTLLIHPRHGSWFLLGELITDLDLAPDSPEPDHCGTCTRCIDACPTAAITPYSVDASRCISYHTLENRGEIPPEFHPAIAEAEFLIGCDICQEVCPFNRDPLITAEPDFSIRPPAPRISLPQLRTWTEHDWDIATRGSAARRAKFPMWQRNAQILEHSHE